GAWLAGLLAVWTLASAPSRSQDSAQPDKAPVPAAAEQAKALKLIKSIFKDDYARAAKDPEARVKLADALLARGRATKEAASHYTLFREACDLAARAGDAALAFTAIEELDRRYVLNARAAQAGALAEAVKATGSPDTRADLLEAALDLIAEAL